MKNRNNNRIYFVWGLKRSGIHMFVNWLYANSGGQEKAKMKVRKNLHPLLRRGFEDAEHGVRFYNNVGLFNSRQFALGNLSPPDFKLAAQTSRVSIFGIEDCYISKYANRVIADTDAVHFLVMRDPLNNIASRLKGAVTAPAVFRVDAEFVELCDEYSQEFLGRTKFLHPKIPINFNQFVVDRIYRDSVAHSLGIPNRDAVNEITGYGGGSSFSGDRLPEVGSLMTRHVDYPLPPSIVTLLCRKEAIRAICEDVFLYSLEKTASVDQ